MFHGGRMTTTSLDGTAKAIGETIRDARLTKDLSKSEAARRAGVSRRTWHEIEEGTRPASSAETLVLFDQVLGFPDGTLFAMTGRSANAHIEGLRQRAIDLVKLMSGDELEAFVDSNGAQTVTSMIAGVEHELAELRAQLGAPRDGRVGSDNGTARPRGRRGA